MCEYCNKGKSLKEFEGSSSYYKIIGKKIEHREDCLDSYYSYTDEIQINYCPMCGRKL